MRVWVFVLFAFTIFADLTAVEEAMFYFSEDIVSVEKHYLHDEPVIEVCCSNHVFLIIGDEIDSNYVEGIANGDVLACGDSIVAITKVVGDSTSHCEYHTIYPHDSYSGSFGYWDFKTTIWVDSASCILLFGDGPGGIDPWLAYPGYLPSKWAPILESGPRIHGLHITDIIRDNNTTHIFSTARVDYEGTPLEPYTLYEYHFDAKYCTRITNDLTNFTNVLYWNGTKYYTQLTHACTYGHRPIDPVTTTMIGNTIVSFLDFDGDGINDPGASKYTTTTSEIYAWTTTTYEFVSRTTSTDEKIVISGSSEAVPELPYISGSDLFFAPVLDRESAVLVAHRTLYFGDGFSHIERVNTAPSHFIYFRKGVLDWDEDGVYEFMCFFGGRLHFDGLGREIELNAGWNMIAPSFASEDSSIASLGSAVIDAYDFDTETMGYVPATHLRQGNGTFVLCSTDTTLTPTGEYIPSVTLSLKEGWNMCGGPSYPIDTDQFAADSSIVMPVYTLDTEEGSYIESETIHPGQGFWLLSTEDHEFVIE